MNINYLGIGAGIGVSDLQYMFSLLNNLCPILITVLYFFKKWKNFITLFYAPDQFKQYYNFLFLNSLVEPQGETILMLFLCVITLTFFCFFYRNHSAFITHFFLWTLLENQLLYQNVHFNCGQLPHTHKITCRKMDVLYDSLWSLIPIGFQNHAAARWLCCHLLYPCFYTECCKQKHHFLPFTLCS